MAKILLLEDDALFAETLIDFLEEYSFEIFHAINGEVALDATYNNKFDIYLFDINVPLLNGITLLDELRQSDDATPTIYVTSHKEKLMLQKAFRVGCDDYMVKPFDFDELLWRIEAKVKHSNGEEKCFTIKNDGVYLRGERLSLSQSETKLLSLLVENSNKIVTKEMIEGELWSASQAHSSGAIRVYIARIKSVLPKNMIENIRGVGYKLLLS